ncbi:MAG TPA: hypothetical protein HA254_04195 [Candidatus Diapherotrites archaeon]|uniref:Nitroreductase domain-containing protein n=1 Tax=Candidatus Iainarchaeum sp. TaxID=3101447 RepID=A0A7J4IYB6_9ARCH|nr:hypothetical protein [Candidatus Diapherotrites archaeon]
MKTGYPALYSLMRSRQSVRKFREKKLTKGQIEKVINAAVTAPSSLNSQPWKFVVLQDAAQKKGLRGVYTAARVKLGLYAQDTSFVEKATPIVVVCEDSDFGKMTSCAMAIQNMFLAAQSMGLASLPSVTILMDRESEKLLGEMIGLSARQKIVLVTFFGYADEKPQRKPKKNAKSLVFGNSLKNLGKIL